MIRAMVAEIQVQGGTEAQVDAYIIDWIIALENSANPLPCPACYLTGEFNQLNHMNDIDGISKVNCDFCHKHFRYGNTK